MNSVSFFVNSMPFFDRLALAMLHFLWQGILIAAVLFILEPLIKSVSRKEPGAGSTGDERAARASGSRSTARFRYALNVVAMTLLASCVPMTFLWLDVSVSEDLSQAALAKMDVHVDQQWPDSEVVEIEYPWSDSIVPMEVDSANDDNAVTFATERDEPPVQTVSTSITDPLSDVSGRPSSTYSRYVVFAWLFGVTLMLLRMCRGIWNGWRLRASSQAVTESVLISIAATQAARLGMKVVPALRYCERLAVPMVVGLIKPVILLPAGFLAGLEADQLRAILCHELAHIYRMDPWVHFFQYVVESVLFFHPAVWWISHRISVEREFCCDDLVVAAGCERIEYAGALIKAAEIFSENRGRGLLPQVTALRASGGSGTQFNRRVRRLLGEADAGATNVRPFAVVCVLLLVAAVTVTALQRDAAVAGDELVAAIGADENEGSDEIEVPTAPVVNVLGGSPQWGGSSRRNHVANVGLPLHFDLKSGANIKWKARLGESVYNTPVVADRKVFIGTNNAAYNKKYPQHKSDIGCLLCFDQNTGELIWQYSVPQSLGDFNHQFMPMQGITSAPVVEQGRLEWRNGRAEKNRLWLMNNRAEVVCLDVEGFKNGNDGPVKDEADTTPNDADVIWRFDLREELGVTPFCVSCSSPTLVGDLLLINSSHSPNPMGIVEPDAKPNTVPAFLAFNKNTGELLWQDNSPGDNILDVAWSSPAFDVIDGVPQAIFAGGDGWLYSFDARDIAIGSTNLLWKFDCNEKASMWTRGGGNGRRNSIVASPVIHDGLIYIATGLSPENGDGPGAAICIDPTKRGDVSHELVFSKSDPATPLPPRRGYAIERDSDEYAAPNPNSALVWRFSGEDRNGDGKIEYEEVMHRTTSCVTVSGGFAVVSGAGYVHCLDARTGRSYWTHDLLASSNGTPLISRNRIYVGDEDGKVTILALTKEKSVVTEIETNAPIYGSLVAGFFNGNRLLIPCRSELLCVQPMSSVNGTSHEPKEWQASAREGSVLAWQSDELGLHFAIYHGGHMATGVGSSWGNTSWKFDGHVAVGTDHGTKVTVNYSCESPNFVTLGGKRYDLEDGRLFGIDIDGNIVQGAWSRQFQEDNRDEQVQQAGHQIEATRRQRLNEADESKPHENVPAKPVEHDRADIDSVAAEASDVDALVAKQLEQLIQQLAAQSADAETMEKTLADVEYRIRLAEAFKGLRPLNEKDTSHAQLVTTLLELETKFRGTANGHNALWNVLRHADRLRLSGSPHSVSLVDLRSTVTLLHDHYIQRAELYTCFPYLIHNCPFEESELLLQEAREKNEFDHTEAAACFHTAEFLQWKATVPTLLVQWQKLRGSFDSQKLRWANEYISAIKTLDDGKSDRTRRSAIMAAEVVSGDLGKVRMPNTVRDINVKNGTSSIFQSGLESAGRGRRFPSYSDRAKALLFDMQNLAVGQKVPEITGEHSDGKPMKLSDFHGKVTLLIFAGDWDNSVSGLNERSRDLLAEYGGRFHVVSVRNDKSRDVLQQKIDGNEITWPCWFDGFDGPISRQWNIREWPATFLIDHEGIIRYRDLPTELLRATAIQLINAAFQKQGDAAVTPVTSPIRLSASEDQVPLQFSGADSVYKVRLTELQSSGIISRLGETTTMTGKVISSITGDLKPEATLEMRMQSGGRIMPDFVASADLQKGRAFLVALKGNEEPFEVMHVFPAVDAVVAPTFGKSETDRMLAEMTALWESPLPNSSRLTAIKQLGYLSDKRGEAPARAAAKSESDLLARAGAIALYRMKIAPDAKRTMEVFDQEMMIVWYEKSGKPQKTSEDEFIYRQQGNKSIMQRGLPDFDYATYVREGIKYDFVTKDEASIYLFFGVPWKVQRKECVPELMKLIDHDNPRVRRHVVLCLNHTVNDVDAPTWEQFERDEATFINRWKTWWAKEGRDWMEVAAAAPVGQDGDSTSIRLPFWSVSPEQSGQISMMASIPPGR